MVGVYALRFYFKYSFILLENLSVRNGAVDKIGKMVRNQRY